MIHKPEKLIRFLFFALIAIGANAVAAQSVTTSPAHPFEPNEELVMGVEFSRALLKNVDVAEFHFTSRRDSAETSEVGKQAPLKLTGEVSSKGFFARIFNLKFREWMESVVDSESFTVHRSKRIDEQGKRLRISEAVFSDGKVSWTERDPNNPSNPPQTAEAEFSGQIQDVLSAIYFLRTLALTPGTTLDVAISDSGRVYNIPVKVVEKKRLKTVLGNVDAVRVDPALFGPKGMMSRDAHISIWYTNDQRRIPVKAKIKTEYGTFNVSLKKITHGTATKELVKNAATKSKVQRLPKLVP